MKKRIYKQLKNACLFAFAALWSIGGLQAQTSSNGWTFSVKGDGTATLGKPVNENWENIWSDTYGWVYTFKGYSDQISGSLSMPSTVTAQTITWNGTTGRYDVTLGNTYTVTETGSGLTTDQRAALTSVSIPSTVTIISGSAFSNTRLSNITIPSSVTAIGSSAFRSDSSLVAITIPASVTSIGAYIFQDCTSLQSATVLNYGIGGYQFANCTALKDVTLSNNLTDIWNNAFQNCSTVVTLTIPASVTSLNNGNAFPGMTGLKTLNFYAKNAPSSQFSGLPIENLNLTGAQTIASGAFQNCTKLKTAILSDSLTTIGTSAFRSDSSLVAITIPASVTSIGAYTFQDCTSLQSATVLNYGIGGYQFANCTALKDVTLSNNLTEIWNNAFQNCSSVETLTIPASVTSLNYGNAFPGMTGLKTLNFYAKNVPSSQFSGLPIENLNLTGAETIASSAFQNCANLKNIILSNSLKTINSNAFINCSAVRQITVPSSVTSIAGGAFGNCTGLQEVTVRWETPLVLGSTPFSGLTTRYIRLNIPDGTDEAYLLASVWRAFLIETGRIQAYSPNILGNNGSVSISIYGTQLTSDAMVELIQNDNTFKAVSITEPRPGQYDATFSFNQIPTGKYDLHIQQINSVDTLITNAVTVDGIVYPKVVSSLTGSYAIRTRTPSVYQLELRNTGNVDALGVNAYIVVPKDCEVTSNRKKFDEVIDPAQNFNFYCEAFGESYSIPNSQIAELMDLMDYDIIPVDTVYGNPFDGNVYQIYVPRIASGGTVNIPVTLRYGRDDYYHTVVTEISAVSTPNTFNPEIVINSGVAVDSMANGAMYNLAKMLMFYMDENMDDSFYESGDNLDIWLKTFDIVKTISRKILMDDQNRVGYNSTTLDDGSFYDYGLYRKQLATLTLVLQEIAKRHSIVQQPDGILNFAAGTINATSANLQMRKATKGEIRCMYFNYDNDIKQNTTINGNRITISDVSVPHNPLQSGSLGKLHGDSYLNIVMDDIANNGVNVNGVDPYMDNGSGNSKNNNNQVNSSWDPNDISGPSGVADPRYILDTEPMNYFIRFENKAEAALPAMFVNIYDTLDVSKYDLSTFQFGNIQIGETILTVSASGISYYKEYDMRPRLNYFVGITADLDTISGVIHWRFETLDPVTRAAVDDALAGFLPPNINAPEGEGSVSFSVGLKEGLPHKTVVPNKADIIFDYNDPITTNLWENTLDLLPPVSSVAVTQSSDSTINVNFSGKDNESAVRYYTLYAKVNDSDFFPLGNYFNNEQTFKILPDTLYSFYVEAVDNVGNAEQKQAQAEVSIKLTPTAIPTVKDDQSSLWATVNGGILKIAGLERGMSFSVYNLQGIAVYKAVASASEASVSLPDRGVYIIQSGGKMVKVVN